MKKPFQNLIVWQKTHKLTLKVYKYTKDFPKEEKYGFVDDMRRAARSIEFNIVEGHKRKGYKDALNFFNRSDASLAELEAQTLLSFDLEYLSEIKYRDLDELEEEVGRLLGKWQKTYTQKNYLESKK